MHLGWSHSNKGLQVSSTLSEGSLIPVSGKLSVRGGEVLLSDWRAFLDHRELGLRFPCTIVTIYWYMRSPWGPAFIIIYILRLHH